MHIPSPRRIVVAALALFLASAAVPRPAFAAQTLSQKEAQSLVGSVMPAVERIRGLKFKKPVAVKVVDDAAARAHFKARLEKFWPEAEVALEQKAYITLGLLPKGTDVVATLLDLLEEQAGGYYDPATETFFILADMPPAAAPVLMAHELTHALDDQHFDLDGILKELAAEDDRGTAMGAVMEGSGTLVMTAYVQREMQAKRLTPNALTSLQRSEAGQAAKLRKAPPLIERLLMAPYLLGPPFLVRGDAARLATGTVIPRDIDQALSDPPRSTEQILHPARYWDKDHRDEPQAVALPDLSATLGRGWTLKLETGLGELTLAALTGSGFVDPASPSSFLSSSWTNDAAAGWDGDRLQLYESEKGAVVVLATVWDSSKDATEFQAALVPDPARTVVRRDDRVVVVSSEAAVDGEALAKAVLDGAKTP